MARRNEFLDNLANAVDNAKPVAQKPEEPKAARGRPKVNTAPLQLRVTNEQTAWLLRRAAAEGIARGKQVTVQQIIGGLIDDAMAVDPEARNG